MNVAGLHYLDVAQRAAAIEAFDPTLEIREFSQVATRLLEIHYSGLRADDLEALLNNLSAFGFVFGLIEQTERFSLAQAGIGLVGAFTEQTLRVILSDQEKATALAAFAEFQRGVPEFASGYCDGVRAAVRLARA